jgi:tetratricopeptide (TPR) repeat protein
MDNNEVHTGTGWTEPWWRKLLKRSIVVPFVIVLVLATAGGVTYWVYHSHRQKETTFNNAIKEAQVETNQTNFTKALATLQAAEGSAQTKAQQATLYTALAGAAQNTGNTAQAIQYVQQSDQSNPITAEENAYQLATYYQDLGENTQAIAEFKIALQYAETNKLSGVFESNATYDQEQIQRLEEAQ